MVDCIGWKKIELSLTRQLNLGELGEDVWNLDLSAAIAKVEIILEVRCAQDSAPARLGGMEAVPLNLYQRAPCALNRMPGLFLKYP